MANLNKFKWQFRRIKARETEYLDMKNKTYEVITQYYFYNRCYYRRPRIVQELRNYDPLYSRVKRGLLPVAFDDRRVSRSNMKSWKDLTKRRKQWKAEPNSFPRICLMGTASW